MLDKVKQFLKKLFPPPTRTFLIIIDELRANLAAKADQLLSAVKGLHYETSKQQKQTDSVLSQVLAQQEQQLALLNALRTENRKLSEQLLQTQQQLRTVMQDNLGVSREILWAQVFRSATSESDWLLRSDFIPGRWAAGYPFLFVVYCVLSKAKPKSILELGLGQSTHMITQYAAVNPDVTHTVTEQDQKWVDIFRREHFVAPNTTVKILPCAEVPFQDDPKVNMYLNFKEELGDRKYDLICIDAPTWNTTSTYHRVDVLSILPDCLAEDFVILLDDFNRPGEQKAAREISALLRENGISFTEGTYRGEKHLHIWCSKELDHLRTL